MGGFEKGKSGNPAGRPRGARGKVQSTLKEWVHELLNKNRTTIEDDLRKCNPTDRLKILLRLLDFVLPKQAAVQARIDFDKLSDEEIDNIVNKLEGRDDENNSR